MNCICESLTKIQKRMVSVGFMSTVKGCEKVCSPLIPFQTQLKVIDKNRSAAAIVSAKPIDSIFGVSDWFEN